MGMKEASEKGVLKYFIRVVVILLLFFTKQLLHIIVTQSVDGCWEMKAASSATRRVLKMKMLIADDDKKAQKKKEENFSFLFSSTLSNFIKWWLLCSDSRAWSFVLRTAHKGENKCRYLRNSIRFSDIKSCRRSWLKARRWYEISAWTLFLSVQEGNFRAELR